MNKQEAEELLRTAVGDSGARFRKGQWEAIEAIANRRQNFGCTAHWLGQESGLGCSD